MFLDLHRASAIPNAISQIGRIIAEDRVSDTDIAINSGIKRPASENKSSAQKVSLNCTASG